MLVIEVILTKSMYQDQRRNIIVIAFSTVAGILVFLFIRQQTTINDRQFLKSMIPHHTGAILMCQQAPLEDAEIRALCETIIATQEEEIAQMEDILQRLGE